MSPPDVTSAPKPTSGDAVFDDAPESSADATPPPPSVGPSPARSQAIAFAPGADENEVAVLFGEAIAERIGAGGAALADFKAMRGSVLVVARDAEATSNAATFRFDHGRLTIHDGHVGVPTISLVGDLEALRKLPSLVLTRVTRLPRPEGSRDVVGALARFARRTLRGELTLYGALANPRLWLRFARVLAKPR